MRGAEGVVDVDLAEGGEFLGELGVVLFFFGVEAQVLKQQDLTGLELASTSRWRSRRRSRGRRRR